MSHCQVTDSLRDLGFCEDSTTLYVHLLVQGPLTLDELTNQVGMRKEQAFPLLGEMIASRLAFEDGGYYWILNPRTAFKAFADDVLWSVTSTVSSGLEDVPQDRVEYVRTVRETCQKLQRLASQLYSHRSPIAVGRIKNAKNPAQLAALLAEAIDSADQEILCVSTSPRQRQLSMIWGSLVSRIENGVRYVRVVDITEIVEHGFAVVKRDLEGVGVELYVIERDLIDCKFYVIDDKFVVMFNPDKYDAYNFTLIGQVISNKLIVRRYRKTFHALRERAIPVSFVLEFMAQQKKQLLERAGQVMDRAQVRWLECLIDYGLYCKFPEFDEHQLMITMELAVREGLVEVQRVGEVDIPLPKYSWSIERIRSLWSSGEQDKL